MSRARTLAGLAAVVALAAAPSAAEAKSVRYSGKTSEGARIRFSVARGYMWTPKSKVPITCRSSNQGVVSDTSLHPFDPYLGFRIGIRDRGKWGVSDPVPTYEMKSRKRGRRITGSLAMSYSEVAPDNFGGVRAVTCSGRTKFSARAVRGRRR